MKNKLDQQLLFSNLYKELGCIVRKSEYSYNDFKSAVINKYLDIMKINLDEEIQKKLDENEEVFLLEFKSLEEDLTGKDVIAKDLFNKRVLSTISNLYMLM